MKKRNAESAPPPPRIFYVGPTLTALGLQQNTRYSEVPDTAKEAFEATPALRNLFVPLTMYPTAEHQIYNQSGAFYDAWVAVTEAYGKKAEE